MYTKIAQLKEKWSECTLCDLSDNRDDAAVCIGQGALECSLLIITPDPLYPVTEPPQPYGVDTEEYKIYHSITEAVGIDRQKAFLTSTVGCRTPPLGRVVPANVDACRERVIDLVNILDPKVVALLGPEAMYSWTGADISKLTPGIVEQDTNRTVIWTYDFSRYLLLKKSGDPTSTTVANKIFMDWKWIKNNM